MKTKIIALAIFALTAATVVFYPLSRSGATIRPVTAPTHLVNERPKIEVVFVLDTTGSMGGLIQAAKDNIWSIATSMASAQPTPEIRMGLVAYRDRGDAYVTRVVDLSSDLDSMYATLVDFQAQGGGDGPESVNQAIFDAVHSISWSQDPGSYKVIFLVGDAPPHMDYADEVQYPQTLAAAASKGIVVNTIQCGGDPHTLHQWQRIAQLADGRYFQVDQTGGAIAAASPFDERIASLSAQLDATRMYYGSEEERRRQQLRLEATAKLHAVASPESRAKRATFNASESGAKNFLGDGELVEDVAAGRVNVAEIEADQLPESMRSMSVRERQDVLQARAAQRDELKEQIGELIKKRQVFVDEKITAEGGAEDSLDYQIYATVKEQAEKKGLKYEEKPNY